jgi:hypothetical protein
VANIKPGEAGARAAKLSLFAGTNIGLTCLLGARGVDPTTATGVAISLTKAVGDSLTSRMVQSMLDDAMGAIRGGVDPGNGPFADLSAETAAALIREFAREQKMTLAANDTKALKDLANAAAESWHTVLASGDFADLDDRDGLAERIADRASAAGPGSGSGSGSNHVMDTAAWRELLGGLANACDPRPSDGAIGG